jgi:8-oxo-dGTP pyrophosphatase MutT (NUDIX family)
MVRRRRGSSFMPSALVFPGGGVDDGETLPECAARELFEEAGIGLLVDADARRVPPATVASLRNRMVAGESVPAMLSAAQLAWEIDSLTPWSHWITPSLEPKRFSAHFFVAALPEGQTAQFDAVETVEQLWLDPLDALQRSGELAVPPPQLRTLWELRELRSIADVMTAARVRAGQPHPILPRVSEWVSRPASAVDARQTGAIQSRAICLLLPWDPDYLGSGQGEALPMIARPAWANGPSRFAMEDRAWRHLDAPGSTSAD